MGNEDKNQTPNSKNIDEDKNTLSLFEVLEKRILTIEAKVDNPPQTKWYKKASIWISISAVIISVCFSTIDEIQKNNDSKETTLTEKRAEISNIIDKLLDIQEKSIKENISNNYSLSVTYNAQREYLFEELKTKIIGIEDKIGTYPFSIIGAQYLFDGKYYEAIDTYKKELKYAGQDTLTRVSILTCIGGVYSMANTHVFSLDSAQKYFSLSIKEESNLEGEVKPSTLANTYYQWANAEIYNSKYDRASKYLSSADSCIAKLSPSNATKSTMSLMTNMLRKSITTNNGNDLYNYIIIGDWNISVQGKNNKNYKGHAYINVTSLGLILSIYLFEGKTLVEELSGQSQYMDNRNISFSFQGYSFISSLNGQTIGGIIELKIIDDKKIAGSITPLSDSPENITLYK